MIVKKNKYVIATKSFPIIFDNGDGNPEKDIEYAYLYNDKSYAEKILSDDFEEPDNFQVLKVNITYEI